MNKLNKKDVEYLIGLAWCTGMNIRVERNQPDQSIIDIVLYHTCRIQEDDGVGPWCKGALYEMIDSPRHMG